MLDSCGDLGASAGGPDGLFHCDTRFLSRLELLLNLAGISYIDSGGLGTLVALYTTAQNGGGAVKLANLTQRVGDLLQVTKLVTVFEVYDSEQDAVDSFKKGAAA